MVTLIASSSLTLAEDGPVFSSTAADLGIVASDLEKSVAFYKDVIGCTEVKGFSVPPAFATSLGLVDQHAVTARVLVLGEGKAQTKLKLMEFPQAEGKGIAHEAAIAARNYAYGVLGWTTAVSYIDEPNIRSRRLAERLGCWHDEEAKTLDDPDVKVLTYRHPSPEALA